MTKTDIDLSGCEREPIQIPGAIQPHGLLFVVEAKTGLILQAGGDFAGLIGHEGPVSGSNLRQILGHDLEQLIEGAEVLPVRTPVSIGRVRPDGASGEFSVILHEGREGTVVELHPAAQPERSDGALARILAASERMEAANGLLEACTSAVNEVSSVTGYDRVMVYQFMPDGSGTVIAEMRDEGLPPFLNHRFPASDLPAQARELYLQNRLRVIPDVNYTALAVLPGLSPVTGEPLDMTYCNLRSVSPIHLRYLRNMSVGASMSVSLVVRGVLWGLIACHNSSPRPMTLETQQVCAQLGQILSREIRIQEELARASLARELEQARFAMLEAMSTLDDPNDALLSLCPDQQGIVRSHGMAAISHGKVVTCGDAPTEKQVRLLALWLQDRIRGTDCFATDRLAEIYPEAATFASAARGLVAIVLPSDGPVVLIWFRAEQVQEVNWAGNPHEPATRDSIAGTLNPRRSFAKWTEVVRGRSRPWDPGDLESAEKFGRRAAFIVQQHRIMQLNQGLEQANARLAAIADTDGLTGIANRRAFDMRLAVEWTRVQRSGGTLALIILDVDHFKKYNDLYGHLAGDECLMSVAQVLAGFRRATDMAARIGGEEFALLLPDSSADAASHVAETVRAGIEALGIAHEQSPACVVTASIGFAVAKAPSSLPSQSLIAAADEALYEAKRLGRNSVRGGTELGTSVTPEAGG